MGRVTRIDIDWRIPPSDVGRGNVVVPYLSAQPEGVIFHEAVLVPSARYTLLPAAIARELTIDTRVLPRVDDPLFPGFALWRATDSLPLRVTGKTLGEHLLVRLPVAFDSTGRLESVVLGEGFFHLVRIHFDPERTDASWIEQFRALD